MAWTSKFKTPLALQDEQTIETLVDARALILSLPEFQQRRPYWEYAAQRLRDAAEAASARRSRTPIGN